MPITDLLNVSQIYELVKKGATLEAQEAILKYREEIIKLTEENLELKIELSDLNKKLILEEELEYRGEVYYRIKSKGKEEGPFCQRCYDVDGNLVRLVIYKSKGKYACYQCNNAYEIS